MQRSHSIIVSVIYSIEAIAQVDTLYGSAQVDTLYPQSPVFFQGIDEGGQPELLPQTMPSLLQASQDVFNRFAGYQFSPTGFMVRGNNAENHKILINGCAMNDPETGMASWSAWSGLNDLTRYAETRLGNHGCRYGFSGAGGYSNIDIRASSIKKSNRFTYSLGNRVYRNRLMFMHATGLRPGGWAFAIGASLREGDEVYVPGTYFKGRSFCLSADRAFRQKHLLSFTGLVAAVESGLARSTTLEVYRLADNPYYNPSWGIQNGTVRNANVWRSAQPMLMLTHQWTASQTSRLITSLHCQFGKTGRSGLMWYKAPDPRPDYYRYLPSYYYLLGDTQRGDQLTSTWPKNNQINWDRLIAMNQANIYNPYVSMGLITSETRSRYIIENQFENIRDAGLNTTYNARFGKLFFSAGLNAKIYQNRKYKEVEDLLGGNFWIDVDQFAEQLGVEEFYQLNDIDNPNKKIYRGDRFGYDYAINIGQGEGWAQAEYSHAAVDVYGGLSLSSTSVRRQGYMANGKFPNNSKGLGPTFHFMNYGLKAGITIRLTRRQYISAGACYLTRPPDVNTMYISPRVRHDHVEGLNSESVASGDLNYIIKSSILKFRFTYYYIQMGGMARRRIYWHDEYKTNINLIMKGLDENHQGIELGIEKVMAARHQIQAALGLGRYVYTSRPTLEAWQDNNQTQLFSGRTAYLKNYRVGGAPQLVTGVSYRFVGRKQWWASVAVSYFDWLYVEANPDRRTAEATSKYLNNEADLAQAITRQEQLPAYYLVNLSAAKAFRITKKNYINIGATVNNPFNATHVLAGGNEQLRWDPNALGKFPPRYQYMTGTTYMLSIAVNF